ncbi:MAG: ABC transporter ATP-binding protein [Aeropyrum sp.]|nr:ABC transporter ATP-binding protein [Aeropyrum sp.]
MPEKILDVRDLRKKYGGLEVLRGVSLSVYRGEVVGLVGPNGAGKTTLLKISLGIARRDGGEVLLNGVDPWVEPSSREKVGVIFERPNLPSSMSVREFLESAARLKGASESDVEWAIEAVGLAGHEWKEFNKLSAGLKQRAAIAHALIGSPEFIIADEPTSNLDPMERREVLTLIARLNKELGVAVLVSSHILPELLRVAKRVYALSKGRIVAEGEPQEIFQAKRLARIRTTEPERLASRLAELGLEASVEGLSVLVRSISSPSIVYEALTKAADEGIPVLGVDLVEPALEEVIS